MPDAPISPSNALNASTFVRSATSGFINIVRAVRKHWPFVAACVAVLVGGALLYSKSSTKIYQSAALLEISPYVTQPLANDGKPALDMGAGLLYDIHDYYETQYKVIASNHTLGAVVRELGLMNDPVFAPRSKSGEQPTIEDVTNALRSHVFVEPIKYSHLVWIKVSDTDVARARRICDSIASVYIEQNLQGAVSSTSDAFVWLSGQLDHVKQDLEVNENALFEFKRANNLPSTSINEASNMLRIEMQEYDTALTRTRTKKEELAARYEQLAKVSADNPDSLPASELLSSAFLSSVRTQYEEAVKEQQSLLAEGKGDNHPLVKRATERVTETRAALLGEVRNIQGAVERDLASVAREESGEAALFDATRQRAVDLNMKEIEYHRLDRARDENEKLYGMLLSRMKESDLARMMRVNNIRVVDHASDPRAPIRPQTSVNVAIGLFLGLVLGVVLAWAREQLDTTLKTPDELESALGITFLGLLPEVNDGEGPNERGKSRRRRRRGNPASHTELVVHERPLSGIAEAARSIRTNILFMNPDRPYRKLLVTSAAPSEGKTTIACGIAIALAQGGQRVCIVDCDFRRPRIHRIFDRVGDRGATNVIVGDATLDDVTKPTVVQNLWSVPAGSIPPNPADLLHSEKFKRMIDELGERFDRVIIDSAPLIAVTDSAIVSRVVDGTVFVVRAFKTNKHQSAQGLRALRDVDARLIGGVLNAVNLNRQEYSYYYYQYYKQEGYALPPGDDGSGPTNGSPKEEAAAPN
jgi:succinoglycan biosynthesis transport protein ExoP